jgi:hypothetical protein
MKRSTAPILVLAIGCVTAEQHEPGPVAKTWYTPGEAMRMVTAINTPSAPLRVRGILQCLGGGRWALAAPVGGYGDFLFLRGALEAHAGLDGKLVEAEVILLREPDKGVEGTVNAMRRLGSREAWYKKMNLNPRVQSDAAIDGDGGNDE